MYTHSASLPPQRLLLATDLCAGCDRPLERARQLAAEWRADVTVLMVGEGPGTPEEVSSWLGSRSEELLQRLPCEILLVPASESPDDG